MGVFRGILLVADVEQVHDGLDLDSILVFHAEGALLLIRVYYYSLFIFHSQDPITTASRYFITQLSIKCQTAPSQNTPSTTNTSSSTIEMPSTRDRSHPMIASPQASELSSTSTIFSSSPNGTKASFRASAWLSTLRATSSMAPSTKVSR